ncbi:transcriptional regulator [Streptomyces sp. NPDC001922]|uniref:transcriptional regulator n=1 Tax=Streptomyces sp. NPDC001922 TaxID=3364624 RepID=UPI0036A2112C
MRTTELTRPTELPLLERLAADRATGALLRDGGTLFLSDGAVVHAESDAAPGLDVLLTTTGRLPAERWQEAVDRAGAHCRVGRHLVDSGSLGDGELEICHLNALFDAAYFALAPSDGPTRFRQGAVHWLGPIRPVRAEHVARESRRRRDLLDGLWPWPAVDTSPVTRHPSARAPAVPHRQRAVLELADGLRTPDRIARLLGRPAFHTLIDVRRLAAAGHIRTPHASEPPPAPHPVPDWVADLSADPDIALLRRLRDALEARL